MSGMVLLFLGDFGHEVHEIHRAREIVEVEGALDAFFVEFPLGHLFEVGLDFCGVEKVGHRSRIGRELKMLPTDAFDGTAARGQVGEIAPSKTNANYPVAGFFRAGHNGQP